MSILDTFKNFIASHSDLLKHVEQLSINEALNLIKTLYPQDVALIAIVEKVIAELEKLQGITPQA